jgi:hypothetical protein
MHVTQPQGGACPEPRSTQDGTAEQLVGLLTDDTRFRAWIAQAGSAAIQLPAVPTPNVGGGYTVTSTGRQVLTDPGEAPGTAAPVLRSAALYLERHGWIQGAYFDPTATIFTPAADMAGAIGMVCYGGPVEAPAQHFDDPGYLDFEEAVLHLDRYLLVMDGTEAYEFNDAKGRTVDQVTHVLRQAAATPAHELLDALRVMHADDVRRAALFGGDPQ